MKRIVVVLLLFINFLSTFIAADTNFNFSAWQKACMVLPKNPKKFQPCPLSNKDFWVNAIVKSVKLFELMHRESRWINNEPWQEDKPFVQKLIVSPESAIYFFGDLHGNIHDLMTILSTLEEQNVIDNNFKITKPNAYFIFLGDYVDRGFYGVEVLYTILRFKLANPNNVFMVRGNHEDMDLNVHYGFLEELKSKFSDPSRPNLSYDLITHFYNHLPSAIYLGCKNGDTTDYIQCCHGGIEIGYNPKALIESPHENAFECITCYNRKDEIRTLSGSTKQALLTKIPTFELENHVPKLPTHPVHNGFMWNDFIVDNDHCIADYITGRGWSFGKQLTEELLKKYSNSHFTLRAIFRAHQHYGSMLTKLEANNGIADLWDGTVYTFLSGKPSGIDFSHANCGVLKLDQKFANWKLFLLIVTQ